MKFQLLLYISLQLCFPIFSADPKFNEEKASHLPRSLANNHLTLLASKSNISYFNEALRNIMVPRVVGTPSHERVKEYIEDELEKLGWNIEEDSFVNRTPNLGNLRFTNIIGRLNPNAKRYLTIACHYDSKYFPGQKFLAATDSAVPCGMMLSLANSLKEDLEPFKTSNLSLMFVFFDGEEAFLEWSDTDSLYGAKHLAEKWANMQYRNENSYTDELDRIDLLVLLDLLGSGNPQFYSYFKDTARWHSLFANIERRLKSLGAIHSRLPHQFLEKSTFSNIQDDHVPFLQRGVPVLHVIPNPFPNVWHTMADDYSALDFPTITTTIKILQTFVLSYLMGESKQ